MATFLDIIKSARKILKSSRDFKEYEAIKPSITTSLKSFYINEENKHSLISLQSRLELKFAFLHYVKSSYDDESFKKVKDLCNEIILNRFKGQEDEFDIPISFAKEIDELITNFQPHMLNLAKINALINQKNNVHFIPYEELRAYVEKLKDVKFALENCSPLCKNAFSDLAKMNIPLENKLLDEVNLNLSELDEIYQKELKDRFITLYEPLKKEDNEIYAPFFDLSKNSAKILILNSPYNEEIQLYLRHFEKEHKVSIVTIDAYKLKDLAHDELFLFFEMLAKHPNSIYIDHISSFLNTDLDENIMDVIIRIHALYPSLYFFFSYEKGDNALYKSLNDTLKKKDIHELMIHSLYLYMPPFEYFIDVLSNEKMIDKEDLSLQEEIKKNMPFVGFYGLNKIIYAYKNHKDFLEIGRRLSRNHNTSLLKFFLEDLPYQSIFIDEKWGSFIKEKESLKGHVDFDYDAISPIYKENVAKILSSSCSLFAKCGMGVSYILLGADDKSKWSLMDQELKNKRITDAVNYIYLTLGISPLPVVEITTELNKNILGQCCEGGRRIQFQARSIDKVDELMNTILHECYHSFQYYSASVAYHDWFFKELGVTKSRISEWILNSQNYINYKTGEKGYHAYRHQIMEADANAFAADSLKEAVKYTGTIDLK